MVTHTRRDPARVTLGRPVPVALGLLQHSRSLFPAGLGAREGFDASRAGDPATLAAPFLKASQRSQEII